MADVHIPQPIAAWMRELEWGEHHDQWHFERRWDYWHFAAANHPDERIRRWIEQMIQYAVAQNWKRAQIQEGEPGNGVEFLMMHRAMIHMILDEFPDASALVEGWDTPPTDPDDPVPGSSPFEQAKADGIFQIENGFSDFPSDDAYGLFIETDIRPIAGNPTNRNPDRRLGVHNYLHGRWTDATSPINLGDPKVNIFNERFWTLHGWIDKQWSRYREARGLSDSDPSYVALLTQYKHMMSGHMHPMFAAEVRLEEGVAQPIRRPEGFSHFFNL